MDPLNTFGVIAAAVLAPSVTIALAVRPRRQHSRVDFDLQTMQALRDAGLPPSLWHKVLLADLQALRTSAAITQQRTGWVLVAFGTAYTMLAAAAPLIGLNSVPWFLWFVLVAMIALGFAAIAQARSWDRPFQDKTRQELDSLASAYSSHSGCAADPSVENPVGQSRRQAPNAWGHRSTLCTDGRPRNHVK